MPERILVVEDDEATRQLIVSTLVAADYRCREAGNGLEALAVLDSGEEFELILSNLMMPKLDGMHLLERVKTKYPDTPFVLETGVQDASLPLRALRAGAYDYLVKPFEREQLLAVVHRALEYRRLRLENRAYQTNLEALVSARTEQLRQAVTTLERSYDISLELAGNALALKDPQTERHSKRVTAFSIAIARGMGLPADQIRVIARGAFVHDIGKIALPDAILFNPSALTPNEMAVMRQHCAKGYEIIKKLPFLAEAAEIVYCHHESYEGTGYPRGLKGEEIPIGARIVAVANTLDAITSNLPYRPARSLEVAKREIEVGAGSQFDPEIVSTFLAMPENTWSDLAKGIAAQAKQGNPA